MKKRILDRVLCVLCFVGGCGDVSSSGTGWTLDHQEESGVLVSVWGSGPEDVWAAGGQVGNGLVLHNDGAGWKPSVTGAPELLWWVYGFEADDVYAVGERGLVLHYDGSDWTRVESTVEATLYGVWGASGEDVWIVGGDPTGDGSAVILRGNRRGFQPVDDVPAALLPSALFKIYGRPTGVIAVGTRGTVLQFDGTSWRRDETPTESPLFSLWGRGDDEIYAVGGAAAGEVLLFDGQGWQTVLHDGMPLSGVFTAPDEPTIAVGASRTIVEMDPDGTTVDPVLPEIDPGAALHGVWGDQRGTTYAVGGDLLSYPAAMQGVILRRR